MLKKKPETAAQGEQIQQVPVAELHPFKDHPFKVMDDEAMLKTVESMARFGVLNPLIVRPRAEGGYEIISGHRRQHAARLAGTKTLPVIVRQLDDDQAILQMVESNLQRETIRPSERAFAYKMKMEVLKHQGARTDLTLSQVGQKLRGVTSRDLVAQEAGDNARNIQRYIRLTHLIPELLELVDQKKISFNPAVELSYLTADEQRDFLQAMEDSKHPPSLSQAQRIKRLSRAGECSYDAMLDAMKNTQLDQLTLKNEAIRKYFPRSYTPRQMEETILKLLEQWHKRRQRSQER
ncbi:MAG TPA: ParB/RepB/Spo0J family partition protein [Candidatus Faecalibacterium gallistercoris]|uniref:ParB/RepB/Spo0J family partition protein n=1 Tax=Candidatus Faecalibacterium gallistercoris TaxID=2838579 RepID=A0A9D2JLI8_9FIRM|nr:ParB/RepB/Spo0J family partition protein [Candidatus Faecalibacterium gallistercoris]